MFKLFLKIDRLVVNFMENALSWLPRIRVEGLTMLYPISCYTGPCYNGSLLYFTVESHTILEEEEIYTYNVNQVQKSLLGMKWNRT